MPTSTVDVACKVGSRARQPGANMGSMFDKYGGVDTVKIIVENFYDEMLSRPNLRRYFSDTPMDKLAMHQVEFIAYALGKPKAFYADEKLLAAHQKLRITDASFNQTKDILEDVLIDMHVEPVDRKDILDIIEGKRRLIVRQ
mgnify:CR=1 FL=1